MMKRIPTLAMVCFLFLVFACNNDNTEKALSTKDLIGTWECVGGKVDGEDGVLFARTENTPGAMIKLTEDIMTFELLKEFGKSEQQPFTLKESKILCDNDPDLIFEIKEATPAEGKMVLEFSAQDHAIEMVLERK